MNLENYYKTHTHQPPFISKDIVSLSFLLCTQTILEGMYVKYISDETLVDL